MVISRAGYPFTVKRIDNSIFKLFLTVEIGVEIEMLNVYFLDYIPSHGHDGLSRVFTKFSLSITIFQVTAQPAGFSLPCFHLRRVNPMSEKLLVISYYRAGETRAHVSYKSHWCGMNEDLAVDDPSTVLTR